MLCKLTKTMLTKQLWREEAHVDDNIKGSVFSLEVLQLLFFRWQLQQVSACVCGCLDVC